MSVKAEVMDPEQKPASSEKIFLSLESDKVTAWERSSLSYREADRRLALKLGEQVFSLC